MRRATFVAMRRLSRRTLLAWAGIGVFAPSCISPTLPLPPPDVPDGRDLGNGQYRLQGSLPMLGTVFIHNPRTSLGVNAGPLKSYDIAIAAQKGDTLWLWYEVDGDQSSTVTFRVDRLNPIVPDGGA